MELRLVEFERRVTASQFEHDAIHAIGFGSPDGAFGAIRPCALQSGQE